MKGAWGRWFLGLLVVTVGIVWLLNNLGLSETPVMSHVFRLWPIVIVYFGAAGLATVLSRPRPSPGALLISGGLALVGLLQIARNYDVVGLRGVNLWGVLMALVVIVAGYSLLRGPVTGKGATHWAVMSDIKLGKSPFDLEDVTLIAIMGGGKVDLGQARIARPEIDLECLAIMGGFDILVPPGMRVECSGISVLGGVDVFGEGSGGIINQHTARFVEGDGPLVRIRASTLMGGIKVVRRS